VGLQQQGHGQTLLVDASMPVPGDAAMLVGLDRAKALGEMAPIVVQMSPEVFASYLTTAPSGIALLPFVSDVLQSRLLSVDLCNRMLDLAADAYDFVVIDVPAGASPLTLTLLERSDYVCAVASALPNSMTRGQFCLDYLRSLQIASDSILFCLNRVVERGSLTAEEVERLVGMPVTAQLPEDPDAVLSAAGKRMPLVLAAPRHPIARGIDRLVRVIDSLELRDQPERRRPAAVPDDSANEEVRAVKLRIHRRLVEEIDMRKADLSYLRDPVKLQEMRTRAEAKVLNLLEEEGANIASRDLRRQVVKEILDEALGLGPLEDFLADPSITEIMVNRHDQIYVERKGRLELTDAKFLTPEQLRGVIERIVAPLGRRIDEKVPMADARLRDGSRVNAIIPPLALKGPALTIRKFSKKLLGVSDLITLGSLTEQMATFLSAAVKARTNIVISGGTGSGKTTLLNILGSFIPDGDRIVTIEDAAELSLPQEHVVALESRPANIEGEGAITIRDLVRNALRMRPDRIVVGECRGGEALDMLQAMNTGHDGSLTTVHANSPRDALSRIETLALMSGLDLPARAIRDQISSAVDLVVQQSRLEDGSRRITHISEVTGQEGNAFTMGDVFLFRRTGMSPDGAVYGQFVPTGYIPAFVETLAHRGVKVPREIFLHQTA
jgi:septum site-determining protein MinD